MSTDKLFQTLGQVDIVNIDYITVWACGGKLIEKLAYSGNIYKDIVSYLGSHFFDNKKLSLLVFVPNGETDITLELYFDYE